jgi:hypothetical protein
MLVLSLWIEISYVVTPSQDALYPCFTVENSNKRMLQRIPEMNSF